MRRYFNKRTTIIQDMNVIRKVPEETVTHLKGDRVVSGKRTHLIYPVPVKVLHPECSAYYVDYDSHLQVLTNKVDASVLTHNEAFERKFSPRYHYTLYC